MIPLHPMQPLPGLSGPVLVAGGLQILRHLLELLPSLFTSGGGSEQIDQHAADLLAPRELVRKQLDRLEGLVEGAFAKVFKGVVHPVEILNAMQREAEAHKAILAGGRTLVPNRYVIDLSPYDHSRLAPYAAALAQVVQGFPRVRADHGRG